MRDQLEASSVIASEKVMKDKDERKVLCIKIGDSPWLSAYAGGMIIVNSSVRRISSSLHLTVAPPSPPPPPPLTATTRRGSARRESRAMFLRLGHCWLLGRVDRDSRERHDTTMLLTTRTLFARWLSRVCRSRAHTPHSRYRPPSPTGSGLLRMLWYFLTRKLLRHLWTLLTLPDRPLPPLWRRESRRGAPKMTERARSQARRNARDSNANSTTCIIFLILYCNNPKKYLYSYI